MKVLQLEPKELVCTNLTNQTLHSLLTSVFRLAKKIPAIKKKVDEELGSISKSFEEDITNKTGKLQYLVQLPPKGMSNNEILNTLRINLALGEEGWKNGYASGAVYVHDDNLQALTADAFKLSSYTNPLHPDLFPGNMILNSILLTKV